LDISQIKALLEKYRDGACSAAESKMIEDWLDAISVDQPGNHNDDFIDGQLRITKERIDNVIGGHGRIVPEINRRWMAIAASVFIAATSALAIWLFYPKKQAATALVKQPQIERYIKDGWVYVQTSKGITDNIKLNDGSVVILNASSRLRYPVKFVDHRRPLYLDEGEALFNVAKDKLSPFTVYTDKFATTALGTAFNVRSYPKEHKVSISLIHGKIRIQSLQPSRVHDAPKILLPHQQLTLNQSGKLVQSNFTDEAPVTAWKEGVLAFDNASMDEVINSLENKFNVVIKNNSLHKNWSYTGTFRNEPFADVINTICLTEGITFIINKNIVTFIN
jgi:ferric-dicitrate binding protein FerR (iron transport regulator)